MRRLYHVLGPGLLSAAAILLAAAGASAYDAGLYNEANALYRDGRFKQAASRYETLVGQGLRNADVYYNLGNAYYKAGNLGRAVLNYQRALRLNPDDPDIRANLRFVQAVKRDQIEEEDPNLIGRALAGVFAWLPVAGLAVFASLCLFALSAVGIGWVYVGRRRTLWLSLLVAIGILAVGSGGLLAAKIHQREAVHRAVVLVDEAQARSGPGADYLQVFAVHEGTTVVVERRESGWTLVRLQNGIGGWIPEGSAEEI